MRQPEQDAPAPEAGTLLLTRRQVGDLLGFGRAGVELVFRSIPTVRPPGLRREYVRREHLDDLLDRWTVVDK